MTKYDIDEWEEEDGLYFSLCIEEDDCKGADEHGPFESRSDLIDVATQLVVTDIENFSEFSGD